MDIEKRIGALKEELAKGERIMADLDTRRRETMDQMLRISGAVDILEELLNERAEPTAIRAAAGD
jgi:hypothetical protein